MDFIELARKRYSARAYKSTPVEEEKLQQVLEAARLAPTAANRQPFKLVVIRTAGRETELQRIYSRAWFTQAPLVICACIVPGESWVRRDGVTMALVDMAIAFDHLVMAATDLGLGTCWIAAFNPQAAREVLVLPEGVEPVMCTPLGYPADPPPAARSRKTLAELIRYEKW